HLFCLIPRSAASVLFVYTELASTAIYSLSLHDALPISGLLKLLWRTLRLRRKFLLKSIDIGRKVRSSALIHQVYRSKKCPQIVPAISASIFLERISSTRQGI